MLETLDIDVLPPVTAIAVPLTSAPGANSIGGVVRFDFDDRDFE